MAQYDEVFFRYVNAGAIKSARKLLPIVLEQLSVRSVLDVGCGQGAWLSVWGELGVADATGVDGDYVDRENLLCPRECFVAHDLAQPFDLGRRFDLVQSLEVAEHLPDSSADDFVASLVRHGDVILFSAAPKGQGGDHHINEQSYDYWRNKFRNKGYLMFDCIRHRVSAFPEIEPWYRYNSFLYVAESKVSEVAPEIRQFEIPADQGIEDISPPMYKLRKLVVRLLPVSVMTQLAKWKEKHTAARYKG